MAQSFYTDLATVKADMSLGSSTSYDTYLTNIVIPAAAGAIEEACGRRFWVDDSDETRYFLPQHAGYCVIDDLSSFTSLVAQEGEWTRSTTPGDGGDFYLEPNNAPLDGRPYTGIRTIVRPFIFTLAQIPAGWAGFDGRIAVTGKWGWPAVPPAIQMATEILCRRLFIRTHDAPLGVVSVGAESEAVRIARSDPDIGNLIAPYALTVLV